MSSVDITKYAPEFTISFNDNLQEDLRESSISVEINEEIGSPARFSLVVADKFDANNRGFVWLNYFLSDSSPLFNPELKIKIEMGYTEKVKEIIVGTLEGLSTSGFSSDITQVTLTGYDGSYKFLTEQSTDNDKLITIEKDDTYSDVAEKIASTANLESKIDKTKRHSPITLKKAGNYSEFLNDAASRVGFAFFISRGTLYFIDPRKLPDDSNLIQKYTWGENLVQFSPSINTADLVKEVQIRGHLPDSKKAIVKQSSAGSEDIFEEKKGRMTGSELADKLNKKKKEITDVNFYSEEEAESIAHAHLNSISDNLVTGSGTVVGNPDISLGQFLKLSGIGDRLSGIYFITSVTHKIDSSGFTTSFNARKNMI